MLDASSATFHVGGEDFNLDLSTAGSYSAIATAITTTISGQWTGATVGFNNGRFTVNFPDALDYGLFMAHSEGTASDISTALGLSATAGARYIRGRSAETVADAVTEVLGLLVEDRPAALMVAGNLPAAVSGTNTLDSLATYAQANNLLFGQRELSANALLDGDTTSRGALSFARNQSQVATVYTDAAEHPEVAALALMSAQELDAPESIVNPHAKILPGVLPTDVTPEEWSELSSKNISIYTRVAGRPRFLGGVHVVRGRLAGHHLVVDVVPKPPGSGPVGRHDQQSRPDPRACCWMPCRAWWRMALPTAASSPGAASPKRRARILRARPATANLTEL